MPVLHQIIAVEKGIKNKALTGVTEIHKSNQKAGLFEGQTRHYSPLIEEGEKLASENTLVQRSAPTVLKQAAKLLSELLEVTAQRDFTNCVAKADVVIDGLTIVKDAPTTYLLFLEKQLVDIRTLISELPTLDSAFKWTIDENTGLYHSNEVQSTRTKKEESFVVVIAPTKEHPGKHEKVTKDVAVGTWSTTKLSGALPIPRKEALLEKVEKLMKAVKYAREEANSAPVAPVPPIGDAIFGYLLA